MNELHAPVCRMRSPVAPLHNVARRVQWSTYVIKYWRKCTKDEVSLHHLQANFLYFRFIWLRLKQLLFLRVWKNWFPQRQIEPGTVSDGTLFTMCRYRPTRLPCTDMRNRRCIQITCIKFFCDVFDLSSTFYAKTVEVNWPRRTVDGCRLWRRYRVTVSRRTWRSWTKIKPTFDDNGNMFDYLNLFIVLNGSLHSVCGNKRLNIV